MTNLIDSFWIRLPNLVVGNGTTAQTGDIAHNLGANKVLIVTDAGVAKASLLNMVKESLVKEHIDFGIFDGCQPNAPVTTIKRCADFAREGKYDLLIGVGGGSVMDTAKLAAIAAKGMDTIEDIERYTINGPPRRGISKILIPTTSGTGSEASTAAVLTDNRGIVRGTRGEFTTAEAAIVDPLLTLNLPPRLTAESGFDAFCHAFEAYTSNRAQLISEALDEKALKLIAENLPLAYREGAKNPEARYGMAVAATMAMASVSMSQASLPHAMGHALQSVVNTSHGSSLSILLPTIMEFNMSACPDKYARVAELMGEKTEGLFQNDASAKAIAAVRQIIKDIELPTRLRDVSVTKAQIPRIVDILFDINLRNVKSNPRPVSREDATKIFEAAW